jgi:Flp pilus assembly pilin Flp
VNMVLKRIWRDQRGVLTFEWILLITLLLIGIVGGYSAVRDGVIDELGDVAQGILRVDQSFTAEAPACAPCMGTVIWNDTQSTICRERPTTSPIP